MDKQVLVSDLKVFLVTELKLPLDAAAIDASAPLFGAKGLGIDSIDALQVGVAAEQKWNIKLDPNSDEGKAALASVNALADFIVRQTLISDLKNFLVTELKLPLNAASIDAKAPLFGSKGLGIDSIDALQVGVAAEQKWNIKLDPNSDEGKAALASVSALADFILAHQK